VDLALPLTKPCANATDKGRVVYGIGEVYLAGGGFRGVLGAADGDGADLAGAPADEAVDGFLSDEERGSTARLVLEGSLEE
jgi:hypothetical protein